jgi:hypothetical protein
MLYYWRGDTSLVVVVGRGGGENVIIIVVLDIVRTNTDIQIRGFALDR